MVTKLCQKSNTLIVIQLQKTNCGRSQNIKMRQNLKKHTKNQLATHFKHWKCDKTQNMTVFRYKNCKNNGQKLKLRQNSKAQIVKTQIVT